MTLQKKLDKAWELKKNGSLAEALELYQQAYDQLADEAGEYARKIPGTRVDEGDTRTIMPSFFIEVKEYLRKEKCFCIILNNMGVIYAEAGNIDSAKRCFEESIEFTPEGVDYPDPHINMNGLDKS